MPELPEVEVISSALNVTLAHQKLLSMTIRRPTLRYPINPDDPKVLVGQYLLKITRKAKYMLWHFEKNIYILHLGMSGSIHWVNDHTEWAKHEHIEWQFEKNTLRLLDPRRFGFWVEDSLKWENKFSTFGPEPLLNWDVLSWYNKLKNSPRSIYTLLMDQKIISGLGNIYVQEALFKSNINPKSQMKTLKLNKIELLSNNIIKVLRQAIQFGGTTLSDHTQVDGSKGRFQSQLMIYGRGKKYCLICNTIIESYVKAQRTVSFCSQCQQDTQMVIQQSSDTDR